MAEDMQYFLDEANETNKVFLVDVSWELYKSFYTFNHLSTEFEGEERPTGHIYGVLRLITAIKKKFSDSIIVLCIDGEPVARKEENENYKADRDHSGEYNIFQDLDDIKKMAYLTDGVYTAFNRRLEADDILYSLAKEIEECTEDTITYIYSGDNDLLQALSDRIKIVRRITKKNFEVIDREYVLNNEKMQEKFRGCPIDKLTIYRAIVGDNSDNIKGLYRFPTKFAARLASHCESLQDLKDLELDNLTKAKQRRLNEVKEKYDKIESNYKIMDLKANVDFDIERDRSMENEFEAKDLVTELSMHQYKQYLMAVGSWNF